MFRVFKRPCWVENKNWPDGWEPHTRPMDTCRTVAEFDTFEQAREFCETNNAEWRKAGVRLREGESLPSLVKRYYGSDRFEFTEI